MLHQFFLSIQIFCEFLFEGLPT
uniref:Uncharacterized protein n=1 Tax=Rhizophora mucronata TaxID=61149 RepID=A0A2P2P2Z4_RHIMU